MALANTDRIRGHLSRNTKRTAFLIHSHPTVICPTSPRRNSVPPTSHQYSGNIQKLLTNNPKIIQDFSSTTRNFSKAFRLQNCLSRKSSVPENIHRLFRLKSVLAANHQYSGNIQRLSGQQQQPAAATSSSNQQQQSAAATSSSNQQRQSATAISNHPTSNTYTINADLR